MARVSMDTHSMPAPKRKAAAAKAKAPPTFTFVWHTGDWESEMALFKGSGKAYAVHYKVYCSKPKFLPDSGGDDCATITGARVEVTMGTETKAARGCKFKLYRMRGTEEICGICMDPRVAPSKVGNIYVGDEENFVDDEMPQGYFADYRE